MAVYERYAQTIPDSLIYEVIDFIKFKGFELIMAPYEADSQLAFLYLNSMVDFIISEDSDMIAYGCYKIAKGLKVSGQCDVLDCDNLPEDERPPGGTDEDAGPSYFKSFLALG